MGCDIHTIVEIKRDGKWEFVPDLPLTFDSRSYGVFSILNRNVRNSYCRDGFEGKGLPNDLSGRKFRFVSCRKELENAFKTKTTFVCYIGGKEKEFLYPYDEKLTVEIDKELFEELKGGMTTEQSLRYYSPVARISPEEKYFVQDAQKVNGEFREMPYARLFSSLTAFNKVYYDYVYLEEEDDYGYYEVDFDSDLHSHSYLSLAELKTKVMHISSDKTFVVDDEFLVCLKEELCELPESMIVLDSKDGKTTVSFVIDAYEANSQENYNDGVNDLCKIKEKYNIASDDDIRIVFAFDS